MHPSKLESLFFPQHRTARKGTRFVLWSFYLAYLCAFVYFSLHHCRWFDEGQAWLIARESNPFNLLSAIKYECHPFLWFLFLMLPAHVFPFSYFTLVTTLIVAVSFYYIIFKSPYHITIRILLPATYFLFYQYGVIARSYVLFVPLVILAALTFQNRFRGNGFFVSVLLMLTLELHSFLVAGGLLAAFAVELALLVRRDKRSFKSIRKYILQLVIAALVAIFVVLTTYPFTETYFMGIIPPVVADFHRLYMVLTESVSGVNTFWMNQFVVHPGGWFTLKNLVSLLAACCFYGFLFWFAQKKHVLLYALLPLLFLGLGLMFFYANSYHMGLLLPVILFASWISLDGIDWTAFPFKKMVLAFYLLSLALVIVQINWTIIGLCYEHHYAYSGLPSLVRYIKQNNLHDIALDGINGTGANAYFDKNIFCNVKDAPYFIFSKQSNVVPDKSSPRYIVTNYPLITNRAYYRIRSYFEGSIHDKGFSVSHDDTFILYELKQH